MGAFVGVYVFLNAIIFWASRLKLGGFVASVVYLGYSVLIAVGLGVLGGGYLSSRSRWRAELTGNRNHWLHQRIRVREEDIP